MISPEGYRANPSDFLAVERTFLAWIRTGLALMALGFVLARFGLFLQEFNVARSNLPQSVVHPVSYGYSLWFGTGLILLGVLVSVLSLIRYLRLIAQLKSGTYAFANASNLAVVLAILLGVLGMAMSYYLVATRHVSALNLP
jgi:putative membrane protein